jgi:D-alanine-D-alanine ligase-like ATP-grasp enzyme
MKTFTLPYCEECGEARIPHLEFRFLYTLRNLLKNLGPITRLGHAYTKWVDSFSYRFFTPERVFAIAKNFSRLGFGTLTTTPHSKDNTRTLALYEGADATGVTLYAWKILGTPICFIAEKRINEKVERVMFEVIPRPRGFVSPSLPWLDDKGTLKEKLMEAKIPCAEGGVVHSFEEARKLFGEIDRPVIAKPQSGSRGRHTTLDIRDEEELKRAVKIVQQLSWGVVIEAYLKGTVHRVTLVGGEPVAVARREYPHVMGDGVHTVGELVEIENEKPYRNSVHFRRIDLNHRASYMLKKQNLTLESIPQAGEMVVLNDKNSRLHGTLTEDVTDTVHPDNMELFRRLADVLADPIVGVDFMITVVHGKSNLIQESSNVIQCRLLMSTTES